MKKAIIVLIALNILTMTMFSCKNKDNDSSQKVAKKYLSENARTEFNENLDLSEYNVSFENLPKDFKLFNEAENSSFSGNVSVVQPASLNGFTGDSYVKLEQNEIDGVIFKITLENEGLYKLTFNTASMGGEKYNYIVINGKSVGEIYTKNEEFSESSISQIYLQKGENEIIIKPYWGWIYVDNMTITPSTDISNDVYKASTSLVNVNSNENTKRLMKFLTDVYGKYIISGQYGDKGKSSSELEKIETETGKLPAMLGLDLIEYTPSRVENGAPVSSAIEHAIDWYYNHGGIVTFCWHWNAPSKYLLKTKAQPWYKGFYKEATNINLDNIMEGKDQEGYDLLMSDIDAIAKELKRLDDAHVPVLWRPLHEASGGWFWWGNCKPESNIKLWNILYDKLTNEHKLNNLIWVWNGQKKEWYPGDETVDIVGEDIYPGEKVYTPQSGRFTEALQYSQQNKIIALTENGCLFDPDLAFRDNVKWAWFCTWNGEFVLDKFKLFSEQYTEKDMWKKVYNHERVLTLDELPKLRDYPLE